MKIILLDNIKGIGRVGDVKDVNDGYARNFLLPRGLGKPASTATLKDADLLKAKQLQAATMEQEQAHLIAERLNGTTIVMYGKANDKGTLFSGITRDTIAKKVSEVAGVHITPDHVTSDEHLKHIGLHPIHVRLGEDDAADLTVDIRQQT